MLFCLDRVLGFEPRGREFESSRAKGNFLKRFDAVEFGLGNLHVVDYSLFWGSIRENVKLRLNEYLKKQN